MRKKEALAQAAFSVRSGRRFASGQVEMILTKLALTQLVSELIEWFLVQVPMQMALGILELMDASILSKLEIYTSMIMQWRENVEIQDQEHMRTSFSSIKKVLISVLCTATQRQLGSHTMSVSHVTLVKTLNIQALVNMRKQDK